MFVYQKLDVSLLCETKTKCMRDKMFGEVSGRMLGASEVIGKITMLTVSWTESENGVLGF